MMASVESMNSLHTPAHHDTVNNIYQILILNKYLTQVTSANIVMWLIGIEISKSLKTMRMHTRCNI